MKTKAIEGRNVLPMRLARVEVLCPKCDVGMNRTTIVGIEVEECPACGGVFFDKGETEKLVQRRLRLQRAWRWRWYSGKARN